MDDVVLRQTFDSLDLGIQKCDASPEEPVAPQRKKYDLRITHHARERWIERIADPKRYRHLTVCKVPKNDVCLECVDLCLQLQQVIDRELRFIDGTIVRCFRTATGRVKDKNFLDFIKRRYEEKANYLDFLISGNAVLVVYRHPEPDKTPMLCTVLTLEMVDATTFRTLGMEETKSLIHRWKLDSKTKNVGKVPILPPAQRISVKTWKNTGKVPNI